MYTICLLALLCFSSLVAMDTQDNDTTPLPKDICLFTPRTEDYVTSSQGFIVQDYSHPVACVSTLMFSYQGANYQNKVNYLENIQRYVQVELKKASKKHKANPADVLGAVLNKLSALRLKKNGFKGYIQVITPEKVHVTKFSKQKHAFPIHLEFMEKREPGISIIYQTKNGPLYPRKFDEQITKPPFKHHALQQEKWAENILASLGPGGTLMILDTFKIVAELKKLTENSKT